MIASWWKRLANGIRIYYREERKGCAFDVATVFDGTMELVVSPTFMDLYDISNFSVRYENSRCDELNPLV